MQAGDALFLYSSSWMRDAQVAAPTQFLYKHL